MSKRTVRLRVITVRMSDMEVTNERVIDHENVADKEWLNKHCYWAFRNNHGVQTAPLEKGKGKNK